MRYLFLLVLGGLAACHERTATVRVSIPNPDGVETPVPGLIVTFLPYDRDLLLGQLEAKAGPRPRARELDSLFAIFRGPFAAYLRLSDAVDRIQHARDSLAAIHPATDPDLHRLADSAARLDESVKTARAALDRTRRATEATIAAHRIETYAWERTTYHGYDSLVKTMASRIFANPVADTTDPAGWATITLTNGGWWATAHSIDPADPNGEWYWNLKIDRDTIRLDPRTGRHRPRY